MKTIATAGAIAALAASATAQSLDTNGNATTVNIGDLLAPNATYISPSPTAPRTATGVVDNALAAFGPAGGAGLLIADDQPIGTTFTAPDPFGRPDIEVQTVIADKATGNPNEFLLTIESFAFDTATLQLVELLPAGAGVGGNIIDALQQDFGGLGISGGTLEGDGIDIPGLVSLDSSVAVLFDPTLATLASAPDLASVGADGTLEGAVSWSAGGADLAGLGIAGSQFQITYTVPTPASASLLAAAGIAASRRRR